MPNQATYDDANLILRLYELRREETMRKARAWFFGHFLAASREEYLALCPPGSQEDAYFRMVTTYWEMAASFITSGVLNQDLFLDSGNELILVWDRVRDLVPLWRQTMSARFVTHVQRVAEAGIERMDREQPRRLRPFQRAHTLDGSQTRFQVARPRA